MTKHLARKPSFEEAYQLARSYIVARKQALKELKDNELEIMRELKRTIVRIPSYIISRQSGDSFLIFRRKRK
jgi:hypothetical protein